MIRAAAVCVTGALLAVVVKRGSPELAVTVTLAAAAAVLLFLLEPLGELLRFLTDLARHSGVSQELFLPFYKTIGIALVVRVGGDLCRDAGESALASVIETAGSICALLVSLPLLRSVLDLLMELMG